MANINGLPVNSAVTHAEFMSRTEDTSTTGSVNFQNVTDSSDPTTGAIKTAGGAGVAKSLNVGQNTSIGGELIVSGETTLNDTLNASAILSDGNINTTANMNAVDVNATGAVTALIEVITPLITATTADIDTLNLTNALTVPSLNVTADTVIGGNLTVNGTTTTLNTATVDSEDPNITLNKTGNDASSENSGLTIDRTGTKGSLVYANALASKFKIGDLASEAEVVTVSHAQTLTNKTLTSPVLTTPSTDIISATEQGSTPATPAGGVRKLYPKADGFYQLDSTGLETKVGSGSGGGGVVNLITNGSADDAIASIFTPYADAAGTRPIDGTGGSPTVTTSISAVSPLTGTKSYLLIKPASNTQGEGWAVSTIPLDLSYRAKALKISVDYVVNSGTFVAGSRTTDSDIIWSCYDITNSKIVEPSNIKMFASSASISDKFEATVQFDYNCTSFRLIAHCATTSALAYELKVEVSISPSVYVYGTPITDFKTVSNPAIIGSSSGTYNPGTGSIYKTEVARNGQEWLVNYYIDIGTSAVDIVGAHVFNLPSECKFHSDVQAYEVVGYGEITNVSTANPVARMAAKVFGGYTSNQVILDRSDAELLNLASGFMTNSSYIVTVKLRFKGMGNSASVQMSDSTDTRVVAFCEFKTAVQSVPNNVHTEITGYDAASAVTVDTHASFNRTTGRYTIITAGIYKINAIVHWTNNATGYRVTSISKNSVIHAYGTIIQAVTSGDGTSSPADAIISCVAGDIISMNGLQTSGAALNTRLLGNATKLTVDRISGPSAIAANETIQALYNVTNSPVMPHNAATNLVYNSKIYDTHGIYNSSTGVITAPISGYYEITAKTRTSIGTGVSFTHQLTVASTGLGGGVSVENAGVSPAGFATFPTTVNPCVLYLLAGQTATPNFYHFNSASATTTIQTSQLSIKKVG